MVSLARRYPFWTFVLLSYGWIWPLAALGQISLAFPLLALFGPAFGWRGFALPHLLRRWPALLPGQGGFIRI